MCDHPKRERCFCLVVFYPKVGETKPRRCMSCYASQETAPGEVEGHSPAKASPTRSPKRTVSRETDDAR